MQFAFFETALRAQKSYSRLMEPVCKKWDLTHNELDVLLFLANNPEQNRAADIVRGRGMSKGHVSLSLRGGRNRGGRPGRPAGIHPPPPGGDHSGGKRGHPVRHPENGRQHSRHGARARVYLRTGNMTNSEGFFACCLGVFTVLR